MEVVGDSVSLCSFWLLVYAAVLLFVAVALIYLNQHLYYRQHLGSLGRPSDYWHFGQRGEIVVDAQPDPLPTTEFVIPLEDIKPPSA